MNTLAELLAFFGLAGFVCLIRFYMQEGTWRRSSMDRNRIIAACFGLTVVVHWNPMDKTADAVQKR